MSRGISISCIVLCLLGAAPARAQEEALTAQQIERALLRYRGEPSVDRIVRAALRTRTADPSRARDAMDRARLAGLLPDARAAVRRGQAVDLRALTGDITPNVSTDDDLWFEASLYFHLDRLLFAPEEPSLLRETRELERSRSELVRAVVVLYFERRRLQLERDLLGRIDVARAIRIIEIEALLDSFTAGAFTRMMSARRRESG